MSSVTTVERWLTMVLSCGTTPLPYTPDGQAVEQILGKIDVMLAQLDATSTHTVRLERIKRSLTELKSAKVGQAVAELPMKDGALDRVGWDAKPEADRRAVWEKVSAIHDELRSLNAASLVSGRRYFALFSILFLLVVSGYLCVHRQAVRDWVQPPLTSHLSLAILHKARLIELQLASLKESQNQKKKEITPPAPPVLSGQAQAPKAVEPPPMPAVSSPGQLLVPGLKPDCNEPQPACLLKDLKSVLYPLPLPYETIRLLGMASAELEAGDITVHVTYQNFLTHLQTDLESLSTSYFWTSHPWRWLELSLWASMGCLVGLLFYIAGLLGKGVFRPEEGTMFMAELLMAPVVVPVIFFLFTLSGISEFIPSQSSITMNIGIAFIFGFAIRRTIGILDIIKKRFFPDPTP